jgi:hypothetical protein
MLRVFLSAPPRADRAEHWVRYDAAGRVIARGQSTPPQWPADATVEVVLAAAQVRLIALPLPPMPRERLRGAVRYALEDQIATALDESSIAVAEPRDGICVVAVASEALIRAIAGLDRRVTRIVAESALAPLVDGWTWCMSNAGDGFVRRADGSAFAVQGIDANGSLPPELAAALAQAARAQALPSHVHVAFRADASTLAGWSQASGVPFASAHAWHWEQASPQTFATAPDFLRNATQREIDASNAFALRRFRPALLLAAAAIALYIGGLVIEWAWLGVENWRLSRSLVETAAAAQLPDASGASSAFQAIARQNVQLRHRALQSGSADALPLLARAAPALSALPSAALRSARYAGDAWTLELGNVDASTVARITRRLEDAGVDALTAATSSGTRLRLSLAATAR